MYIYITAVLPARSKYFKKKIKSIYNAYLGSGIEPWPSQHKANLTRGATQASKSATAFSVSLLPRCDVFVLSLSSYLVHHTLKYAFGVHRHFGKKSEERASAPLCPWAACRGRLGPSLGRAPQSSLLTKPLYVLL